MFFKFHALMILVATTAAIMAVAEIGLPQKYFLNISTEAISDLRTRLSMSRYPVDPARKGITNELGLETADLKKVVQYWMHEFDWKTKEEELNALGQYTITIDSMTVHYIHVRVADKYRDKIPTNETIPLILFVHGWPSTAFDFIKMIPLMSDPDRQGNLGDTAFDVLVPSMVGFPLSSAPVRPLFGVQSVAKLYSDLVRALKYETYIAAGGDWGSMIVPEIAILEESLGQDNRLLGIHINGVLALPDFRRSPYLLLKSAVSLMFPRFFFDAYETAKLSFVSSGTLLFEMSYFMQQVMKPLTIGTALHNSPTALAAWLVEKYVAWTDSTNAAPPVGATQSNGGNIKNQLDVSTHRLENGISLEDIATTLSLYWFTDSITSSVMMYHNSMSTYPLQMIKNLAYKKVWTTPVGIADFPMDILWAPLEWAKSRYKNVVQYSRFSEGGHFPALEVPQSLAADLRAFTNKLKNIDGTFPKMPPSAAEGAAQAKKNMNQEEKASADEEL